MGQLNTHPTCNREKRCAGNSPATSFETAFQTEQIPEKAPNRTTKPNTFPRVSANPQDNNAYFLYDYQQSIHSQSQFHKSETDRERTSHPNHKDNNTVTNAIRYPPHPNLSKHRTCIISRQNKISRNRSRKSNSIRRDVNRNGEERKGRKKSREDHYDDGWISKEGSIHWDEFSAT